MTMTPGSAALHDRVVAALRQVADEVIVPRFNNLQKDQVRAKTHPTDYVTVADEETERQLIPVLRNLVPRSQVVGEEGASADIGILDAFASPDPVWIVDPIDGTANFVNGVARFATMIALVMRGETVMGWIHEPLTGKTLIAEAGAGAWQIDLAGTTTRQTLSDPPMRLKDMVVAMHHKDFARLLKGSFARQVWLGSAAHDYWSVSDGRIQLLSYRRLKPWDHAAGVLIHREAGGYNSLINGAPYRPSMPDQEGLLCAPTAAVWSEVVALLRQAQKSRAP